MFLHLRHTLEMIPGVCWKWKGSGTVFLLTVRLITVLYICMHYYISVFLINTFTAPTYKLFSGRKMKEPTCKQYVFWSYNIYFQCLVILIKVLSHAGAKKETKRLKGFRFCRFQVGRFQVIPWQWRGWSLWNEIAIYKKKKIESDKHKCNWSMLKFVLHYNELWPLFFNVFTCCLSKITPFWVCALMIIFWGGVCFWIYLVHC